MTNLASTNWKKALGIVSAAAVLGGLFTALSGQSVTTASAQAKSSAAQNGGSIVIGQGSKYNDQLIPMIDSLITTYNIDWYAYDPLINIDSKLHFVPDLAKSWSWSKDKKTLTMHLQPNAVWSDGVPITSKDVLFTMDFLGSKAYATKLQGYWGSWVATLIGSNEVYSKGKTFEQTGGFTIINDKTFQLHFQQADAAVLYSRIANIQPIPEHILAKYPISTWANLPENKQPTVVSGPYKFVKVNGQDSVQMTANDKYWKGKPHITNITFKTVNPDVAPGLLASGELDFMMTGFKLTDVSKVTSIPNMTVHTMPEIGFDYLGFKFTKKEYDDVRVRQAFEYALNRPEMIKGIMKGYAEEVTGPLSSVSWAAATAKDGMNSYPYNPAKANKLLDAAGWKKGKNGWRIDPITHKTANLHLSYASQDPTEAAKAVAIQQAFANIGVKVTLNTPVDSTTLYDEVGNNNKSIDLWLGGWLLFYDPDPRGMWGSNDSQNFPLWKDKHNDALIAKTWNASAFNQQVRLQRVIAWQKYVNQQLPYIFLWAPDMMWVYNNHLHIPTQDFTPGGVTNIQDWWVSK